VVEAVPAVAAQAAAAVPGDARAAAAAANGSGLPEVASELTLPDGFGMENYVAGIERSLLQNALNQSGGVQTKAADILGISYRSFRHLMKKYGL